MARYFPQDVEKKWQKYWEEHGMYKAEENSSKKKLYVLDMFPYPSGDGLHVGHVEAYVATDIYSRFKRMQGFNVLHPMGWDAFGLPAENYAIKTGVHPAKTTENSIANFKRQINDLGLSYDWSREIDTHTPEYYKWTQWIFLLLYKNGLAYKAKAKVNWCESCKTVLANEQVVAGRCERCKNEVSQRELEQWFFKITDFVEDLISGLGDVDWPSSTVSSQKNWIGKSEGALLKFLIADSNLSIEVFTTRPDTLFGTTYIVLSPEHELILELKDSITNWKEVESYIKEANRATEEKEKSGIELKGIKAVNPANNEQIPIFIADYVMASYGTGAIMAVPAHDQRDFEFAKKYNLPVKEVVVGEAEFTGSGNEIVNAYTGEGILIHSEQFDAMASSEARWKITNFVKGKKTVKYHLRDWLISRQRYWGAPIPIVYDPEGNAHAVSEEHLPWILPEDVEFRPTGTSPLAESKELLERTERIFGKGWKPEVDTMDTFVCSSWYYLRFADPSNSKEFASKKQLKKWLPVDMYMGGAEHTVLHLLYARFFTKVLNKFGYVDFKEPFLKLRHQGIILAQDGRKMSKSLGNVINPDGEVKLYGADAVRMYEMFMGPLEDAKPWNTKNIAGISRFLEKVWRLKEKISEQETPELLQILHKTIKKVGEDIDTFNLNTAISQLMILVNKMEKEGMVEKSMYETLILLLAPLAPHITEELWHELGNKDSVHEQHWPKYDAKQLEQKEVRFVVQVNGRVRDILEVSPGISEKEVVALALKQEKIKKWFPAGKPKNVIFVKGRLLNLISY